MTGDGRPRPSRQVRSLRARPHRSQRQCLLVGSVRRILVFFSEFRNGRSRGQGLGDQAGAMAEHKPKAVVIHDMGSRRTLSRRQPITSRVVTSLRQSPRSRAHRRPCSVIRRHDDGCELPRRNAFDQVSGRAPRVRARGRAAAHALGMGHRRSDSRISCSSVHSLPSVAAAIAASAAAATAACAIAGFQPSAVSAALACVRRIAASSLLGRRS